MKLILAIINDDDIHAVLTSLTKKDFYVTKMASTGGFLKAGNTTIICGIDAARVDDAIEIIKHNSKKRTVAVAGTASMGAIPSLPTAITTTAGGATIFVIDVEQFIKA